MNTCEYCGSVVKGESCNKCGANYLAKPLPENPPFSERERLAECERLAEKIEYYGREYDFARSRTREAAIKNVIDKFQRKFDALMAQR